MTNESHGLSNILRCIVAVRVVMRARENHFEHDDKNPNLDASNYHKPNWPDLIILQNEIEAYQVKYQQAGQC